MPSPRHKLIALDWPDFGAPAQAPVIPLAEYESRIDALLQAMEERRLTHLVLYGDREHFANLAWLTHFDPRFEEALLILRPGATPLILTGNECMSYLPVSPLYRAGKLRAECYQPFSLLDQPRNASRQLEAILAAEDIGPASTVGCIGWKYYGDPYATDLPSYLIDSLRVLTSRERVIDATDLLTHPGYGLRTSCSAAEIAFFEYTNVKASEAMKRIHFAIRPAMTDHELIEHARYDGLPLSCHMTLKAGPGRISLASARGTRVERGYPLSANIAYWGANVCRAAWVAESPAELPSPAQDYVPAFAGPYFEAMAEWLGLLRIGTPGAALHSLIQQRLPYEKFGVFLNAGHLIHYDEWVSSPIYEGSTIPIRSGMVFQTDVIPSNRTYFSTRMEDGLAVADETLRRQLATDHPECARRIEARRRFLEQSLGLTLPPEHLPLSNIFGIVVPFLLKPHQVLALES
jgi:Xaa-Pro aminopeptidase